MCLFILCHLYIVYFIYLLFIYYFTGTDQLTVYSTFTYPILPPFNQDPNNANQTVTNVMASLQPTNPTEASVTESVFQAVNLGSLMPGETMKAVWQVSCGFNLSCSGFSANVGGLPPT
jgi:hypothetical protein